jgi:hypothetical protein
MIEPTPSETAVTAAKAIFLIMIFSFKIHWISGSRRHRQQHVAAEPALKPLVRIAPQGHEDGRR